jgi:uncharacterized protein YijF (DUF1287 family)
VGPIRLRLATEEHAKRKPLSEIFGAQGLMIPEMPPQRSAKPGFAPSSIIERAAQHLDWTIAFGVRHNSLRGPEGTTTRSSGCCVDVAAEVQRREVSAPVDLPPLSRVRISCSGCRHWHLLAYACSG